jgi:hypothetical protein
MGVTRTLPWPQLQCPRTFYTDFNKPDCSMVAYFNCTMGKVSHAVKDHTWSARPAAIAGVRFCHQPSV